MKKTNKIFILSLISLIVISCGREADMPVAESYVFDQTGVRTFSTTKTLSTDIRAATIVVYPTQVDVKSLNFSPLEGTTSSEWQGLLDDLEYQDRLATSFSEDDDAFKKALDVTQLIFASGRYRDEAFKRIEVLDSLIAEETATLEDYEIENRIDEIDCYYVSRPSYGESYQCHLSSTTETRSRPKSFYTCEDWARFEIIDGQESEANFLRYSEIKSECDKRSLDLLAYSEESSLKRTNRVSAENVVLDLLLETELVTNVVLAAKVATQEKPDDIGPESTISFSADFSTVTDFQLYIDFLPGNASRVGYGEYSISNGLIKDLSLYTTTDGVKKVKFSLELPDMTIEVDGDLTIDDSAIGVRLVDSQTYVHFNNGQERRGVFKIELDVL
jgi:hypothetical protein